MSGGNGGGIGSLLGGGAGFALGGPAGAMIGAGLGNGLMNSLTGGNKINVPDAQVKPEWNLTTPDGKLREDLLLGNQAPKAMGQSQATLDQLLAQAQSKGPTQQAQYLMDQNQRNTQNALDQGAAMTRSGVADASNNLAMRGGLNAGSRERMQRGATFEGMMNQQRTLNDSAGNRLDILSKDEAQKQATLQALPSQLLAQAGFEQGRQQFDIQNTLGTVGGKYNTDMQAWGANQAAREQAQLANQNRGLLGLGFAGL